MKNEQLMTKQFLLWLSVLLLATAGMGSCSSDDDSEAVETICGYWEYSGATIGIRHGFCFQGNGRIKEWNVAEGGQYNESDWNYSWYEDSGKVRLQYVYEDPMPDMLYYEIVEVSASRLVIRQFGGFAGTPYEKGTDMEFRKLQGKP